MMKRLNKLLNELVLLRAENLGCSFSRKSILKPLFLPYHSSKYAGFGAYEIESNGHDHTVVLHHELVRKWSIYVAHLMSQGLKSTLDISPRLQISENSVIFEFFIQ
jgi:hypothetical protein